MSREAMEDGWCDWEYHSPLESSLLCCDCELIHEVDVRVVRYESLDSEVYEVVNDPNLEAQIRLRRRDDISPRRNTGWVYADDTSQKRVDEMVKTEHDRAVELGQAYERGWNAALVLQEPVAWLSTDCIGERYLCFTKPKDNDPVQPLYTTPPKKEWVGLTDEEIQKVVSKKWWDWEDLFDIEGFSRAIEAKLKEKNT